MILSKCLNCKHTWLARKVDKHYNFVQPTICPRCKVKNIESQTVGNPTFKANAKELKRVMGARKYDQPRNRVKLAKELKRVMGTKKDD